MKKTNDNQVRDLFTLLSQTCGPINEARLPNVEEGQFNAIDTFVQDANSVSQALHDNKDPGARIIFKHTNHVHAPGHISDTKAQPDIAAAHEKYWFDGSPGHDKQGAAKDHVWWPFVSLAANRRSEGKDEKEALDALDLLLLSRPDVLGAFGLLIDEECVVLYFAIGGFGFDKFSFRWGTFSLRTAMATMIYTLYHPWTNPSISLMDSFDFRRGPATYEITFSAAIAFNDDEPPAEAEYGIPNGRHSIECPGFIVRAAHGTAGTRTHVFVFDTANAVSECPRLSGRELRVIKSQLVKEKDGLKFEPDFFRLIHGSQRAPGVIPMTCYEYRPRVFPDGRRKRHVLLAMEVEGQKFSQIMKPRDMLLASYNTLEILRFLYTERSILHGDLSPGNVLFTLRPQSDFKSKDSEVEVGVGPTFASFPVPRRIMEDRNGNAEVASATLEETQRSRKYAFLMCADDESQINPVPMVIDFNHAKDTAKVSRTSPEDEITGTPMYIARTLEDRSPNFPASGDALVRPVPSPHGNYSNEFEERLDRFSGSSDEYNLRQEDLSSTTRWQHELYHDVESVFWMIYVWLFFARPSDRTAPSILASKIVWSELVCRRGALVTEPPADAYHPVYNGFQPLIRSLTHYLKVDPYWFEPGTPRRDPEYVLECFQRIIHAFLVKNWNQDFLKTDKSDRDRKVERAPWTGHSPGPRITATAESQ